MATSQDYLDFLTEQMTPLGAVQARRMFGGAGLFLDGLMFALIIDEVLYFKTDAETAKAFDAEGLPAFSYLKKGEVATLTNYRRAPERLLDDADDMVQWAGTAAAVSRRVEGAKTRKAGKSGKKRAAAG